MKTIIWIVPSMLLCTLLIMFLSSCKKEEQKSCYICDIHQEYHQEDIHAYFDTTIQFSNVTEREMRYYERINTYNNYRTEYNGWGREIVINQVKKTKCKKH